MSDFGNLLDRAFVQNLRDMAASAAGSGHDLWHTFADLSRIADTLDACLARLESPGLTVSIKVDTTQLDAMIDKLQAATQLQDRLNIPPAPVQASGEMFRHTTPIPDSAFQAVFDSASYGYPKDVYDLGLGDISIFPEGWSSPPLGRVGFTENIHPIFVLDGPSVQLGVSWDRVLDEYILWETFPDAVPSQSIGSSHRTKQLTAIAPWVHERVAFYEGQRSGRVHVFDNREQHYDITRQGTVFRDQVQAEVDKIENAKLVEINPQVVAARSRDQAEAEHRGHGEGPRASSIESRWPDPSPSCIGAIKNSEIDGLED